MKMKYVLLTNLRAVLVNGVSTNCSALLLETRVTFLNESVPSYQVRGFGPDSAWEVFKLGVTTLEYTLTPAENVDIQFLGEDGKLRTIFKGAVLTVGEQRFDLFTEDSDHPVDIMAFEGEEEDRVILKVWDHLLEKAIRYTRSPGQHMLVTVATKDLLKLKKDLEFAMHTRAMGMKF